MRFFGSCSTLRPRSPHWHAPSCSPSCRLAAPPPPAGRRKPYAPVAITLPAAAGRRQLRGVPHSARRRRQGPRSMPSSRRWCCRRASSGTATSAGASIRASPRSTISPLRSRLSTATAAAGTRSRRSPPRPRSSRWIPAPASSARRRARAMTASPSPGCSTPPTRRHRLGLSARGRDAGPRRAAAGRSRGRHARTAFRPPARLRRPGQRTCPGRTQWARVAMPDGKTGFVAPGSLMSLTAERALLHQGPGRRLADCRIYRRGR